MTETGRATLITVVACLALGACGGDQEAVRVMPGQQSGIGDTGAPSLAELQSMLQAEFARLGIDPAKVTAKAPQKSENAVFDLAAELIDPDGEGSDPPTGIALGWTERLIGDYNQDGMVTQNDLTPIGQNYAFETSLPQIGYENPEQHGGFEQWPGGDPDDDGGTGAGNPPTQESGARNWRLARIDGNGDGFILMYDIPAIAQHWQEQLSGYRLYRKAPDEVVFILAETVTAQRDGLRPVRYFHMNAVVAEGEYAFYVAPYDSETGLEGPPSGVLTIDTMTGTVNQSPVAKLTVTPDFAGAPAVITMDASGSYDPDGTVAGYAWDFDGDGTDDWLTGDPVPEQSSDGTVTEITPGADGVVTVTFPDGSADWKYPQVAAWDDQDALSLYTLAKLGISGWHELELMESTSSYLIDTLPVRVEVDPATNNFVLCSPRTIEQLAGEITYGPYLHWQQPDGSWEREKIPVPFMTGAEWEGISIDDIVWDEFGNPLILIRHVPPSGARTLWSAQKQGDGSWDVNEVFQTDMPEHLKEIRINPAKTHHEPGRFACMISECLTDKPHIAGLPGYHTRRHILCYDNGSWMTEFTGIDSADTYSMMCQILGTGFDDLTVFHSVREDTPGGPWWSHWEEGIGPGTPERMDGGILNMSSPNAYCLEAARLDDGTVVTTWDDTSNTLDRQFWMLSTDETSSTKYDISELSSRSGFDILFIKGLYSNSQGVGLFSYHSNSAHTYPMSYLEHRRLENGEWLVETASLPHADNMNSGAFRDSAQQANGDPVVLTSRYSTEDISDISETFQILERLDPRV